MQFRQKALAKLQSPEELDVPVRFARPQGRLALAVTIAVMAVAGIWAFTGSVTSKLSAVGVLTHAGGGYLLQSPYAGQVTEVLAEEGRLLPAGAPLLRIGTDRGDRVLRVVAGGRVTNLAARTGSVLTTGADVATVERTGNLGDPMVAVLYVPAASAATVPVGAPVDLGAAASGRRDGALRGHVKAVGRAPRTRAQITGFLGDRRLAEEFSRRGDPVEVLVELAPSSSDESTGATTPVTASVHLAAQRPVDWLLP